MDRRAFLRSSGLVLATLSAGGVLAACGDGDGLPAALRTEGQTGPGSWNLINASFETLTGEQRRFAFGLTTIDNEPVSEPEIEVYTRPLGGEVTGGPYPVEFYPEGPIGLGIYLARLDLPDPVPTEVIAVRGDDHGVTVLNVVAPDSAQVPAPGTDAIATATPTPADDLGMAELCTRDPDCSMHEVSLDEALGQGRPIVMMFATPAYCQTAVCGPGVDTLEEVRQSREWGEIAFIHSEIFTDAGETIAPPVAAWQLPSEPWLFTIDADGTIADRIDGPMIREELARMVRALT